MRAFDGKTLGERLRQIRVDQGKTVKEVAHSIEIVQGMLSNWEVDRVSPNLRHFAQLAEYYGVSMDELFWGMKS